MSVQPTGVPAQASSVSTGLALMALAMLIIPSMDILGKLLSKEINGIQVAQWRFGFQALYILPFLLWLKGASGLLPKRIGLNLLRAVLMAGAVTCFFTALRWMSVPDAIAVFFVGMLGLHLFLNREKNVDLLIMGWHGRARSRRFTLGSTVDPIIERVPCNVVILKNCPSWRLTPFRASTMPLDVPLVPRMYEAEARTL